MCIIIKNGLEVNWRKTNEPIQKKTRDIQNNKKQKGPSTIGMKRGSTLPKIQTSEMLKRINVCEIQDIVEAWVVNKLQHS